MADGANQLLVDVALDVPLARALTYLVPAELAASCTPGRRVLCTIGSRRMVGIAMAVRTGEPPPKAKPILEVLGGVSLPEPLVVFLARLASYYLARIGEVVRLALPPVDRETERMVEAPTLFSEAKGIAVRQVQWVSATDVVEDSIKEGAARLLAVVRAHGTLPLSRLEEQFSTARATVKKLRELGLVTVEERDAVRDPFFAEPMLRDTELSLTEPQQTAVTAIEEALARDEPSTFLLHGVTGSGKTEVYLRAIADAKRLSRGTIVLVPEIALTPQLVGRFRARFGDDVAVLHSGLTARERFDMWNRLRSGEVDVAIGARSALFAPVRDLGLVIVDEEHDPSFKQEEGVRYNARDMAIMRAHMHKGVCVLGSATPSLESIQLTRSDKATLLVLPDRARAQAMPKVVIVDLRRIGAGPTGDRRISLLLHRAIEETLEAGEQTILFLNRRGFAPSIRCESCGELASCPHCTVAMTLHKRGMRDRRLGVGGGMRCHMCDHEAPLPTECKKCKSTHIALEGLGTEKLEEALVEAFPKARIARLDRDVATGKQIEKILDRVRAREVDILVGTQMVTKGHDLPFVTLVGVINADAALSIPDFRASERAFQLLVQVAGRAGRGDTPGRVLVQTYDPEHHAIRFAARHDVDGFIDRELRDRKELGYPPFSRMVVAKVDALDEQEAQEATNRLAIAARAASKRAEVTVLGPTAAPIAKVRNRFRFRVMLRSASREALRKATLAIHAATGDLPRSVRVAIDVDPVGLL
ncbi:MAG: Helicase PriA essential for oriC/DnaA-independent replication [Labilithrix sp.]|nr:Helicase PriA essential for oriC/DnaA-independent replication [Labilithrix sp.]